MKKYNIIMMSVVVGLCILSWGGFLNQSASKEKVYQKNIEQADEWVSKGLYQRAIENYTLVLKEMPDEELYVRTMNAYQLRYQEEPEATKDDYVKFLKTAVKEYPSNRQMVDRLVDFYIVDSDYKDIYECLRNAIANGYDSEDIQEKLLSAQYAYTLKRSEFSGLKQSDGNAYYASRKKGWNLYDFEKGYVFPGEYGYVGLCNKDGVVVVTGNDSRIVTVEGKVLGIFGDLVSEAGIFADDLLPACVEGRYNYYNEFAEKQFGEYEMAGMFQNGLAAVKSDNKWFLVNVEGEAISEKYEEIVIDYVGRYKVNDRILAKSVQGKYGLYDEKFNLKAEFECSQTDVLTSDGLIAVCQNGKWGYVNTDGEMVIKPAYEQAKSFSNGLAAVCKDGLWGFINKDNKQVIECQFSDVGYMNSDGICPVRIDKPDEINVKQELDEQGEGNPEIWKFLKLELGIK